ncbi:hypothetical protein SCHPADRAFT_491347 [Schizopora paradoxa]|uniref:Uncharacterized protein n=1 Tax=Schizopora paradoxa TaxID=27342 RepID=A0A0H2S1Y8_9AGAM|nr:hypothetical protein SCHPADRAFT_491347 [Schizopora paradoxa]
MGRPSKYKDADELREARKRQKREWYTNHKDIVNMRRCRKRRGERRAAQSPTSSPPSSTSPSIPPPTLPQDRSSSSEPEEEEFSWRNPIEYVIIVLHSLCILIHLVSIPARAYRTPCVVKQGPRCDKPLR